MAASSARVTGFRRAVKASVDSGWAAGGATSAEALGYVTVALRQSGHTPLASPHESRANSRPQFLQFANGRALTISIRELQKRRRGHVTQIGFLATTTKRIACSRLMSLSWMRVAGATAAADPR